MGELVKTVTKAEKEMRVWEVEQRLWQRQTADEVAAWVVAEYDVAESTARDYISIARKQIGQVREEKREVIRGLAIQENLHLLDRLRAKERYMRRKAQAEAQRQQEAHEESVLGEDYVAAPLIPPDEVDAFLSSSELREYRSIVNEIAVLAGAKADVSVERFDREDRPFSEESLPALAAKFGRGRQIEP